MAITNYTQFFSKEKDVYCQNISNCNVVVQFDVGQHTESHTFVNSKDPVNLTTYIPFDAIKSSMDFRKMLNRQPPALRILTEEEFEAYFHNMKDKLGLKTVDEAQQLAEAKRVAHKERQTLPDAPDPIKLHEVIEDDMHMGGKKIVRSLDQASVEDEINPKVLNLCLQVHPQVPENQKMTAQHFISELDTINDMSFGDWEYIQSHGTYKSVKNLAKKKLAELSATSPE